MLSEILESYSEGELAGIVGLDVIHDYQKLTDSVIEKPKLLTAVICLHGFSIVSDSEQRAKLIERMTEEQVSYLYDKFLAEHGDQVELVQNSRKYEALTILADKWPERFIDILGYSESLQISSEASRSIHGIQNQNCQYPMYPYQREVVNKIQSLIYGGETGRCLLHLPTGSGKTRTAMNIASQHLRENESGLVLWLADTSELCSQAVNEFSNAWQAIGNRELKIYSYFSDTNISLGGIDSGFLVAGLQKLNSTRGSKSYSILYEKLRAHVTFIIFDEAHKAIATTYAKSVNDMINVNNNTFFLGLTATPGRTLENNSVEDEKLTNYFESNKVTMRVAGYESPIQYLVEERYLAKANFLNIDYDGNKILLSEEFADQKRSDEIREALSIDDSRNLELIEVITREHNNGSSIIVFACSVEHSRSLASMLALSGIRAYSLDSKSDNGESRRFKIADYSKRNVRVIVNYNILTAGFDAPVTNVAIIARPTDSLVQYSQMAGRAMRGELSGGNQSCRIYTVRDDIPAFTSVIQAFSHWDNLWTEV